MKRSVLPIALAVALLGLAACETADQTAAEETIHWNTPAQPPSSPPPPPEAAPPPPPPPAPPQAARPADEPQCREYQTTVMIGGKPEKAYGKACRQPDGTWKEQGVHTGAPEAKTPVEQSYPYGWNGYDFPSGPRYGPGGMSVGVGAGSGGGFVGYGVGF